jgi:hypothetical protein
MPAVAQDAPGTNLFIGRCAIASDETSCMRQSLGLEDDSPVTTSTGSVGVSVAPPPGASRVVAPSAPGGQAITSPVPGSQSPLTPTPTPQPSPAAQEPGTTGGNNLGTFINGAAAGSAGSAADRRTDPLESLFD